MIIYTDGSCLGNGKENSSGGFGVVVLDNDLQLIEAMSHKELNTTNNRMELKAIAFAFIKYGSKTNPPVVYSDSAYCVNTFNDWMFRWAKNGWVKSDNKTPENLDIIKCYYDWYQEGYRINLQKIKGHAGNYWNEIADQLATGKLTPDELKRRNERNVN